MPPIKQWQVYHIPQCRHAKPIKDKFVVVACTDPVHIWCFLINSKVNQYVVDRTWLYPCMVSMKALDHRFMPHDSWIDCRNAYDFAPHEMISYRGSLSVSCAKDILVSLPRCPVLRERFKEMIPLQAGT